MIQKLKQLWDNLMTHLFRASLLLTFLGIIPTILYIYYNMYYRYNTIKCLMGCVVLFVLVHINKSIQGGK